MSDMIQYYGTGRRKTASARVFLRPGEGGIEVNDATLDDYFSRETLKMVVKQRSSTSTSPSRAAARAVRPVPSGTASPGLSSSTTRSFGIA